MEKYEKFKSLFSSTKSKYFKMYLSIQKKIDPTKSRTSIYIAKDDNACLAIFEHMLIPAKNIKLASANQYSSGYSIIKKNGELIIIHSFEWLLKHYEELDYIKKIILS